MDRTTKTDRSTSKKTAFQPAVLLSTTHFDTSGSSISSSMLSYQLELSLYALCGSKCPRSNAAIRTENAPNLRLGGLIKVLLIKPEFCFGRFAHKTSF